MAAIAGELSRRRPYCMEVTWKLRNFFRIPAKVNSSLKSESFSLAKADWRLELYPNGTVWEDSVGHVDIYLRRMSFSVAQQRVKVTFSFKTIEGKNFEICSFSEVYTSKDEEIEGVAKFISRSQLEKKYFLLPKGTLTVHCEIRVEPSSDDSGAPEEESSEIGSSLEQIKTGALPCQHLEASSQTEMPDACQHFDAFSQTEMPDAIQHLEASPLTEMPDACQNLDASLQTEMPDACKGGLQRTSLSIQKLQTDYKNLLESKKDSDVCLTVSDKEFRAHKCILGARSPVFSAMFEHDMEEKDSSKVVIEDLDPESFPAFLQHIYSGSTDELSEDNVFNLFTAADKYDLTDLRSECKDYMKSTLSVDTFCDVMIVALRYREDDLLKLSINFFAKNLKKIIVTVKWQKFLKEYDTAANELFIKALVTDDEE